MIRIHPCFGLLESGGPLMPPAAAARLARSFATVLPPGGKVLLVGDTSPEVRPAMLACKAQFAFMGHPVVEGSGCLPAMAHWLVPHQGYAGGMGFSGTSCWLIGPDGRCPNEALWECILAKFDGGGADDAADAVAADGRLPEKAVAAYWEHLQKAVDTDSIRSAQLRVACAGLPEHARFGECLGVEMLPFSSLEAVAEALPYLQGACGMVFDPAGKKLTLLGSSGALYPPDTMMLVGSFIALEQGCRSIVSGGFMTRSWGDMLRKYDTEPCVVSDGEGSAIISGTVCGTVHGEFSFGGHSGYDALRSAAYLLEFLARGNNLDECVNKLRKYHILHREVPRGAALLSRLKGRFNAEETVAEACGLWFEFADGALSAMALPDGRALVCSEGRKLQDARDRMDTAYAVLSGGGR